MVSSAPIDSHDAASASAPAPARDKFRDLRHDYGEDRPPLLDTDLADDPIVQFEAWYDDALRSGAPEPNAMSLATVGTDGRPSSRIVLLRAVDRRGFTFFSSYRSRKADDIQGNPRAALLFFWPSLERQVRVEGTVELVDAAESDAYFATRPRGSRIAAIASPQSEEIADRAELERRVAEVARRYEGQEIERPVGWGGYRVAPDALEFWAGRPNRLHDRIRYVNEGDSWRRARLAP